MGRKYGRKRQYILLYIACVYGGLSISCSVPLKDVINGNSHLESAHRQIRSNDFTSALSENQLAMDDPVQSQVDLELFQRGLIYGHPKNPERNLTKSRSYFQELINKYPDSTLATAAGMLILDFDKIGEMDNALKKRQNAIEAYQSKMMNKDLLIKTQEIRINELNNQIVLLQEQIENYKTIDLHIEQKKKVDILP